MSPIDRVQIGITLSKSYFLICQYSAFAIF